MMTIPAGFTTETHTITAHYNFLEDSLATGPQPVDTNGNDLQEITADLIDFFNNSEETAKPFDVWGVVHVGDDAKIDIRGVFYKEDGEGGYTEETVTVQVIIQADEK